jgi:hypothetical protein
LNLNVNSGARRLGGATVASALATSLFFGVQTASAESTDAGPLPTGIVLSPETIEGGHSTLGTLDVSEPGDENAHPITFTSSDPAVLSVPAESGTRFGSNVVLFSITTTVVSAPAAVTITATLDGVSVSGTMTVTPHVTPPGADTVKITKAQWDRGIITVEATSSNPKVSLAVYGDDDPSTIMFTLTNEGGGKFKGQHQWLDDPGQITVMSNLGGLATAKI